jgi:hypothetical protein
MGKVAERLGDVAFYPFEHPVKTARAVGLVALSAAATMLTVQASVMLAEHGPTRPAGTPQENPDEH